MTILLKYISEPGAIFYLILISDELVPILMDLCLRNNEEEFASLKLNTKFS